MPGDAVLVLLIILGAVLILRGPKMLPKLGEAFGRGVKDARKEVAKGFGEGSDTDGSGPPSG